MSPDVTGQLVVVLLGAAVVASAIGWTPAGRQIWPPGAVLLLAAAVALGGGLAEPALVPGPLLAVAVGIAIVLAVLGGGPVTTLVFDLVDRQEASRDSMDRAGEVLRGGAWIGGLERAAVVATLLAGWPEGVAVVLAVKGLGRYPELRGPGTAERFIVGTLTSVLWAAACAGAVLLAR